MKRSNFPLLSKITYLDNAASTLKPKIVIKSIKNFYTHNPVNPNNKDSTLGYKNNLLINKCREDVGNLLSCTKDEVIFTSGTTDSINKFAIMIEHTLNDGDEIIVDAHNHNSNVGPWLFINEKRKKIKVIVTDNILSKITKKTRLIAMASESNLFQSETSYEEIKKNLLNKEIIIFRDEAQTIASKKISLGSNEVIVFSGNKIYGPTGIGVLAISRNILKTIRPCFHGGSNISEIRKNEMKHYSGIRGFETGTPNTAGIIGMGAGINYFLTENSDMNLMINYAFEELSKLNKVIMHSKSPSKIIIFNIKNINSQDVSTFLSQKNIIVRSGKHCSYISCEKYKLNDVVRISLAPYNNKKDIDKLIKVLKNENNFITI